MQDGRSNMKITIESVPGERAEYITKDIIQSIVQYHPHFCSSKAEPLKLVEGLLLKVNARRKGNQVIRVIHTNKR